jgi:hypothetical protein
MYTGQSYDRLENTLISNIKDHQKSVMTTVFKLYWIDVFLAKCTLQRNYESFNSSSFIVLIEIINGCFVKRTSERILKKERPSFLNFTTLKAKLPTKFKSYCDWNCWSYTHFKRFSLYRRVVYEQICSACNIMLHNARWCHNSMPFLTLDKPWARVESMVPVLFADTLSLNYTTIHRLITNYSGLEIYAGYKFMVLTWVNRYSEPMLKR